MTDDQAEPATTDDVVIGRDHGLWAVRSDSPTVYYLDLGECPDEPHPTPMLLRSPGPGSPRGPWDGCWLVLVRVEDTEGRGRVRVGRRHLWTMDPGGWDPYVWWIQRSVTAIEQLAAADHPPGRRPDPDEANKSPE